MAYGGLRGAIAFSLAMIIDLELHTFKGYELEAVRATHFAFAHHRAVRIYTVVRRSMYE